MKPSLDGPCVKPSKLVLFGPPGLSHSVMQTKHSETAGGSRNAECGTSEHGASEGSCFWIPHIETHGKVSGNALQPHLSQALHPTFGHGRKYSEG